MMPHEAPLPKRFKEAQFIEWDSDKLPEDTQRPEWNSCTYLTNDLAKLFLLSLIELLIHLDADLVSASTEVSSGHCQFSSTQLGVHDGTEEATNCPCGHSFLCRDGHNKRFVVRGDGITELFHGVVEP